MANDKEPRKFTGAPAVRASVPLWIGLYGVSGGGKTYSALRLAKGIQSVSGGKIGVGDTENRRALHYAGEFDFVHYHFAPPFDPLSYLDLIEQMAADGVTIAIIDSGSHEHEGTGGVIEMHEAECERLSRLWKCSIEKAQMSAWAAPKKQRRKMIQCALRSPMHIIWCFRAKEKLDVKPGRNPIAKGFMPIAAEELVYEMAMTALLLPGAKGVPTWESAEIGEKQMIKLPGWAQSMLKGGGPLDEKIGAALARWAQGTTPATSSEMELEAMQGEMQPLKEQAKAEAQAASREERQEFLSILGSLSEADRRALRLDKFDLANLHTMARERVLNGMAKMRSHIESKDAER